MSPTILFTSPKRGGILQSSGFLDLKSLMSLSQTCKAHAFDELSLVQLIENEITRDHKTIQTVDGAISFWRKVCRNRGLKRWLNRNTNLRTVSCTAATAATESTLMKIDVTRSMLQEAVSEHYDVMLQKMLRSVPEDDRLQMVCEHDDGGMTLLHHAAYFNNNEAIKCILASLSESERLQAVSTRDSDDITVLHDAARSGNLDCIKTILSLYPEATYSQVVCLQDDDGETVLHAAVHSDKPELVQYILTRLPQSQRLQTVNIKDRKGKTVLQYMDVDTRDSVMKMLQQTEDGSGGQLQKRPRSEAETDIAQHKSKRQKS